MMMTPELKFYFKAIFVLKHRIKFIAIAVGVIIVIYVITFIAFAAFGGYMLLPSGKYRPILGLATSDTWVWQPRYGLFHLYINASGKEDVMADNIGYFYSPLILTSQKFFKPSKVAINQNSSTFLIPIQQMHPDFQKIWKEASTSTLPIAP